MITLTEDALEGMNAGDTSATSADSPGKSPDLLATLPVIEDTCDLLLDCRAAGAVGIVWGPPGTGKTVALRRIVARAERLGLPGEVVYYCCQAAMGPTRGIKDLLTDMGIGGALVSGASGAPTQLLFKLALRDFTKRQVSAVLLDETDRWSAEAVACILALHDHIRDGGSPFTLLLTSSNPRPDWVNLSEAAQSRTLRAMEAKRISADSMVALMALWSDDFAQFAAYPDDALAHHIHTATAGDLRRLNFLVRVHDRHFRGKGVTVQSIEETLRRMGES